jgi:uncharacterized protein DUF4328
MDTPWVCNGCKSINRPGANQCYSCRAPRAIATSAGFNPDVLAAARGGPAANTPGPATAFVRTGDAVAPLWTPGAAIPAAVRELFAGYRSTRLVGSLAIVFIALAAAGDIAATFHMMSLMNPDSARSTVQLVANIRSVFYSPAFGFYVAYAAISIAAAFFFLSWIWLATRSVSKLGGGWPSSPGLGLIGWWFVPIANLFMPARYVEDLRRRMAVSGSAGPGLLGAWWICWVGAQVLPNIGGFFFGFFVTNLAEALRLQIVLTIIATVLYCAAAFFVILLIRDIQRSQDVRATALAADGAVQGEMPRPSIAPQFIAAMGLVVAASAVGLFLTKV